jgi:phage virion morphogenesis protein
MLEFSISGLDAVLSGFDKMRLRSGDLRPLLLELGEDLTESTKQRFVTTTAPDGTPWAKNSDVTLAHKSGSRPLTDGGFLADSIKPKLVGDDTVQVAPDKEYAAMMQFGGTKAEFPDLWGDIPARPYIGFSDEDEQNILAKSIKYLL